MQEAITLLNNLTELLGKWDNLGAKRGVDHPAEQRLKVFPDGPSRLFLCLYCQDVTGL